MDGIPFYMVDVFAEEKYSGNELAVIRHGRFLSDLEMQRIAREINFSETTFILRDEANQGGFDVRIFTPQEELPFAGHPTLGTAYIIQQELLRKPVEKVVLNLKAGPIPVTFTYKDEKPDILWMRQLNPKFGPTLEAGEVAPVLGLEPGEIEANFPIEEVSTGIPFVIVPLASLQVVQKSRLNPDKWSDFASRAGPKSYLLFCRETCSPPNDLHVRVFAPSYGVPEDPATGSANGCLAGYLIKHRYFGRPEVNLRVEQGYEVGHPSLLLLQAAEKGEAIEVLVGGKVQLVARGVLV